jgi:hypothetical protein
MILDRHVSSNLFIAVTVNQVECFRALRGSRMELRLECVNVPDLKL